MNTIIFLNGHYASNDKGLARKLIRQYKHKSLIAVDGGILFLQKLNIKPDYWLTDLDSTPQLKKGFLKGIEMQIFSQEKDKTDFELALDLCLKNNINSATILGWYDNNYESDHLMGNLCLGFNSTILKSKLKLRYLSGSQEIFPLMDESLSVKNRKNKTVSIVPISSKIRITLRGVKYRANNMIIKLGQSKSFRNLITAKQASISIKGKALVVINN